MHNPPVTALGSPSRFFDGANTDRTRPSRGSMRARVSAGRTFSKLFRAKLPATPAVARNAVRDPAPALVRWRASVSPLRATWTALAIHVSTGVRGYVYKCRSRGLTAGPSGIPSPIFLARAYQAGHARRGQGVAGMHCPGRDVRGDLITRLRPQGSLSVRIRATAAAAGSNTRSRISRNRFTAAPVGLECDPCRRTSSRVDFDAMSGEQPDPPDRRIRDAAPTSTITTTRPHRRPAAPTDSSSKSTSTSRPRHEHVRIVGQQYVQLDEQQLDTSSSSTSTVHAADDRDVHLVEQQLVQSTAPTRDPRRLRRVRRAVDDEHDTRRAADVSSTTRPRRTSSSTSTRRPQLHDDVIVAVDAQRGRQQRPSRREQHNSSSTTGHDGRPAERDDDSSCDDALPSPGSSHIRAHARDQTTPPAGTAGFVFQAKVRDPI